MSNEDKIIIDNLIKAGHSEAQALGLLQLHKDSNHATDLSNFSSNPVVQPIETPNKVK